MSRKTPHHTHTETVWHEVTRAEPCPACGKPDWCGRSADAVRCMRITEPPPGWKAIKHDAEGGTTFKPITTSPASPPRRRPPARPSPDWSALHERHAEAITYPQVEALSYKLFVTVAALYQCDIGWDQGRGVYTFAERDGGGSIIGISTRSTEGGKRFIPGGKRGLTIPDCFDVKSSEPLLVVEGVSDVAAVVTLNIQCIGRPSCTGGVDHLAALLADYRGELFVVGERDRKPDGRWPGRDGAEQTAQALASKLGRAVMWTLPPGDYKDLRQWLEAHDAHTTEELREVLL